MRARCSTCRRRSDELRDRYGRTTFGQSCLVGAAAGGKGRALHDHQLQRLGHAQGAFPDHAAKLPELDKGLATLLQDLSDRGLLESTIVWCCGEFGRTPKVQWEPPWNGGRNHWGKVFSALVAGGGFKGGQVVGSSDGEGEEVKDRPVYPVRSDRQHVRAAGHRRHGHSCRIRRALAAGAAHGRGRRAAGRTLEGNHVRNGLRQRDGSSDP